MLWSLSGQPRLGRAGSSSPKITVGGGFNNPTVVVADDQKKSSKGALTRAVVANSVAISVKRLRPADESDSAFASSLDELARSQAAEFGTEVPNNSVTSPIGSPATSKVSGRHRLVEVAAAVLKRHRPFSRLFRRKF